MTTLVATCDGHARGVAAGAWGMTALPCNTSVGLTTWTDTEGQSHRACHPHLAAMRRRFPVAGPACYFCGRDLSGDFPYTRMDFGKWGIHNVCDICDERSDDGPDNTAAGHEHWDDGR